MIEKNEEIISKIDDFAQKLFDIHFASSNTKTFKLNEICEFIPGYSYKGEELKVSDTGMVSIKCIDPSHGFRNEGIKSLLPLKEIPEQKRCNVNDILVCHTDLTKNQDIIGQPLIIPTMGDFKSLTYSMDLVKVKTSDKRFSNALLYRILNSENFKKHALGFCSGTTVVHLSKNALQAYAFNGPSTNFDSLSIDLQNLQNEIVSLTNQLAILENQKQLLLAKYFS